MAAPGNVPHFPPLLLKLFIMEVWPPQRDSIEACKAGDRKGVWVRASGLGGFSRLGCLVGTRDQNEMGSSKILYPVPHITVGPNTKKSHMSG